MLEGSREDDRRPGSARGDEGESSASPNRKDSILDIHVSLRSAQQYLRYALFIALLLYTMHSNTSIIVQYVYFILTALLYNMPAIAPLLYSATSTVGTGQDNYSSTRQESWPRLGFLFGNGCTLHYLQRDGSRFFFLPVNVSLAFLVLVFLLRRLQCRCPVLYCCRAVTSHC